MKRIRVTVTQEDIDGGKAGNSAECPLARALQRRGWPRAAVGSYEWSPTGWDEWPWLPLSRSAGAFVSRVDAHEPVKPATFLLPVPE